MNFFNIQWTIFGMLSLKTVSWCFFFVFSFVSWFYIILIGLFDWLVFLIDWLVNSSSSYCFIFYFQICLIFFIHTNFLSLRKNFHILNLNTFWWIDVISRTILQNYVFLITINSIFVHISHHSIPFSKWNWNGHSLSDNNIIYIYPIHNNQSINQIFN